MPSFAHFYGIRPWELGNLTFAEIAEFRRQLRDAIDKTR